MCISSKQNVPQSCVENKAYTLLASNVVDMNRMVKKITERNAVFPLSSRSAFNWLFIIHPIKIHFLWVGSRLQ